MGIGKVIGDYQFKPESKHAHIIPVEWYDTTERDIPIQEGWMQTVASVSKEKFEELTENYLLLRHSPKLTKWDDHIGKKYHYGKIPNYKKLFAGTKTIWYDREDGDFYYWGYGNISKIEKESENDFIALFENFTYFNQPTKEEPGSSDVIPKKGLNSTKEKIMTLPGWNNQISMLKITKDIYDEIVNGRIMSQLPEITPTRSVSDGKLRIPTKNEVKKGIKEIQKELLIEDSIIEEVVTHLASGRHVLLAGPVGTGKTRLSQLIPEMFWTENSGYFADVRTATADWNTQDVIGGISPKITDNPISPLTYEFENRLQGLASPWFFQSLVHDELIRQWCVLLPQKLFHNPDISQNNICFQIFSNKLQIF